MYYSFEIFQSEQLNSLTASNAELSTNVATLNTQKTRLDGQLKESSASIRKLNDEKKQIIAQMEEVTRNCTTMQQQLQDANKKVETSEQSIKAVQEEMAQKQKENVNAIEGNNLLNDYYYAHIQIDLGHLHDNLLPNSILFQPLKNRTKIFKYSWNQNQAYLRT